MESIGNSQVDSLVTALAEDACKSLFEAYGVSLRAIDPHTAIDQNALLSGVIGFSGPSIRGTCILAATSKPIMESNPVGSSPRDWIAELANQLIGRIKNRLLEEGVEVYVTTPVVLRGEHLAPMPRLALLPQLFTTEGGNVFVWIEVETDPDFELAPRCAPAAREGEALLF